MSTYGAMHSSIRNAVVCDLRSDTVTHPDSAMRAAMAAAEVGDDVYGEDPSIIALENRMAGLLGKDAAMFVSSGTQSNLCAIMAHCGRGDELIVGDAYHIYVDEAAGASVLAGVSMHAIPVDDGNAVSAEQVKGAVKDDDPHYARSRLLCLENTVGGKAISLEKMRSPAQAAWDAELSVHLDGARFFNAITELKCTAKELADCADSISVCFSKGLGAPVGSILVGSHAIIARARRNRKILGGGLRQAGVLAAAATHALDHHLSLLPVDHDHAAQLADALHDLDVGNVHSGTNMVFFTPNASQHNALHAHMEAAGVRIGGQHPTIRMVMHRDIDNAGLEAAITAFRSFYA
jgi:threonine aldolase